MCKVIWAEETLQASRESNNLRVPKQFLELISHKKLLLSGTDSVPCLSPLLGVFFLIVHLNGYPGKIKHFTETIFVKAK